MSDLNKDTDNFVEVDGVKYQQDPESEGEALKDKEGNFVPFEEKKEPEDTEPPVRLSAKDYIIARKNKKIEKLEEKKKDDDDDDDLDGGEDVTPEGKRAIKKEVEKASEPMRQAAKRQADESELAKVLKKYPSAEKMESQIRKYMEHPAYQEISIEFIFLGLAAKKDELQQKKEEADAEAKKGKMGGHSRKKQESGPIPDVTKLTDEEFDALTLKVKTGQL